MNKNLVMRNKRVFNGLVMLWSSFGGTTRKLFLQVGQAFDWLNFKMANDMCVYSFDSVHQRLESKRREQKKNRKRHIIKVLQLFRACILNRMWNFYTSTFNIKVRGMKRRTKILMFTCFQHIPLTKILVIGFPTLKKRLMAFIFPPGFKILNYRSGKGNSNQR